MYVNLYRSNSPKIPWIVIHVIDMVKNTKFCPPIRDLFKKAKATNP